MPQQSRTVAPGRMRDADMVIHTSGGPLVVEMKSFAGKDDTNTTIARLLGRPAPATAQTMVGRRISKVRPGRK